MDDTRKVFGIDLGTTYSCVAQVDEHDKAVVYKNFDGMNTTPSVVYFERDDKVIVGEEAKNTMVVEPDRTVAFVKRNISTDAAYEKPTKFPAGTDPTQISAYILKKIVKDANDSRQDPDPVTKVVITCPAYFGTKERMRTKQAGEIAGLEVLAVINEPTAAAIAYGMKLEEPKTVLVYDLGGGTFDVTIIRVNQGMITVVATGGDHHLGGYDWDTALAGYLLAQFNSEHGTSYTLDSDVKFRNQLMLTAEEKKKSLTGRDSVKALVDDGKGKTSRIEITRQMFEQLTESQLDETIDKTNEVIAEAKVKNVTVIDEVLLVGGSSKMPQVKARVDRELNCNAKLTDPDECVAKGAAIYALNASFSQAMDDYAAGDIDDKPKDIGKQTKARVVNVTSKSYGTDVIVNGKDMVHQLIFANTALDGKCTGVGEFYTSVENQSAIRLDIYESNVKDEQIIEPSAAELLEKHTWTLSKAYPKGAPVKVVFDVDAEGILHVTGDIANDHKEIDIQLKGVKSDEEMQTAISTAKNTSVE